MKLNEGRIGRQETAVMVGIAVYVGAVFSLDSQRVYSGGNSTYIWVPLSILLSLTAVLAVMMTMEKTGDKTLDRLFITAFGPVAGRAASLVIIALMTVDVYIISVDFMNMIHSFAFFESDYWSIVIWVLGTMFLLGMWGLECISRTSIIIGPLVAIVMIWVLVTVREGYSIYRLYPLPGNKISEIAMFALEGTAQPLGALVGLLVITPGVHGVKFARNSCIIGGLAATGLALITQLAIGMTYGYMDLSDIFFPLYRIDMMLVKEGYFFRMDTLLLFIWLTAAIVAGAYSIYTASLLWCRSFGPRDTRPGVAALCGVLGCAALLQARGDYSWFRAIRGFHGRWGWLAMALIVFAACVALIRNKVQRRAGA